MDELEKRGKLLILVVIISSIIFSILHSFEMPFQEYPNKLLLNIIRLTIIIPLIVFIYKGYNWARLILGTINSILLVIGIFALIFLNKIIIETNGIIFLMMLICVSINVFCLLFFNPVKAYVGYSG